MDNAGGSTLTAAKGTISANSWHHVAISITRNSSTGAVFYIDGVVVGSATTTTTTASLANAVNLAIGQQGGGGNSTDFDMFMVSTGTVRYRLGVTGSVTSTANIADGAWHHVVCSMDRAGDAKIFIDGTLSGSSSLIGITDNVSSSAALEIGRRSSGNNFTGSLDEVRFYNNRALSSAEARQLYNFGPSPVAYWNLDEGSGGTANDTTGNSNTGTLTNGPTWKAGKYGKAVLFDGNNDSINFASNMLAGKKSFSVGMWAYYDGVNTTPAFFGAAGGGGYWRSTGSLNAFVFIQNTGCTGSGAFTTNSYIVTGWHHYTLTMETDGTTKLYRDGTLINSSNYSTYQSGTGAWDSACTTSTDWRQIGRYATTGTTTWSGMIDEVKIYNYARNQSQIAEDMQGGPAGSFSQSGNVSAKPGAPTAFWHFDEGQGTTANNSGSVGSTINGTLGGMSAPATSTSGWNNSGKVNKALTFDGTDDNVDVGDLSQTESASQVTWSFWTNPTTLATVKCFFCKFNIASGFSQGGWGIQTGTSDATRLLVFIPTSTSDALTFAQTPTGTLSNGSWYHVAVVFDGTGATNNDRLKVYVNGRLQVLTFSGSAIPSSTTATTSNARIGAASDAARFFTGLIDEPKVYTFALTADQVKEDYNQGLAVNYNVGANTEESTVVDGAGNAPVAYWNFNERTGNSANDTSGNANTGTLNNKPTWSSGKYGSGLTFVPASNTHVTAADSSSLQLTSTGTIEAWVFPTSYPSSGNTVIFNKGNWGAGRNFYSIYYNTASIRFDIGGATATNAVGSGAIARTLTPLNQWSHVVLTWDGSTARGYINGIQRGTVTQTQTPDTSTFNFFIGSVGSAATTLDGRVDDVKVYNYARSASQVAYDYNRGNAISWWKLDECQGTTANDAGGTSNTGSIVIGSSGTQTTVGTCTGNSSAQAWSNGATGKYNASLKFDGTDDYMTVPDSTTLESGNFSLSAWFKTSTGNKTIVEKRTSLGYALQISNGNKARFVIDSTTVDSTNTVTDGNWHHVVGTYDNNIMRVYLDGVLQQSATVGAITLANSSTFDIGANDGSGSFFNGQIDDVRYFSYPLSASQVKKLYNDNFTAFYGPSTGSP